ncbi:unnamed protein product [Mesocestoides corti]|uniref:Uncharacterized protein n=1 Tax=Mesocestoides corti TaxID=53468 RepID=A0A3P6HI93_MESCO|nr:unnamed protein product [Mesocestoides corti]
MINGWQRDLAPTYLASCMETLKSLAIAKPMDQPALPADSSPVSHHEGFSNEKLVRSSFGRPVNTTLHPLSTLTEVHVDKMPIVRKISIQRLPQHLLPSSMSFEAISSITSIDDRTTDRSSTYAKRKTFNRQPTFITNPFQLATSDTVDWVCNDLAYIDVVFDNPFAIPLSLDEMEEVMLKPFSGCLIEQVSLHLLHGIAPEAVSYVSEVVLPPNSTGNRFAFGLVPPRTISEIESEKWRLCALSYRLITFGGFRVNLPLAITNKSSSTLNTSSLQLSNSSTWSDDGDPSKVGPAIHVAGDVLPPIRMCPPLPRLCILVGPSTHEKVEPASLCRGLILDNLAGRLPSFSPTVQLASTSHNQDTRHNLCDIVIDLHPFETRWLPIQLFVVENACPCEEIKKHPSPSSTSSTSPYKKL